MMQSYIWISSIMHRVFAILVAIAVVNGGFIKWTVRRWRCPEGNNATLTCAEEAADNPNPSCVTVSEDKLTYCLSKAIDLSKFDDCCNRVGGGRAVERVILK